MKAIELNKDIRKAMKKAHLCGYEVANEMHIHPSTFAHWLQTEQPAERKAQILKAIERLSFASAQN
jgi:hypothetical protein